MRNKNLDGMRYPSIDDLLKVIDSKYKLAYVAAKVAKLIDKYPNLSFNGYKCEKSVGLALEEIIKGTVHINFKEPEL